MQYEKHFSHICRIFKSKVSFSSEGYISDMEIKLMNNTEDACLSHTNYIPQLVSQFPAPQGAKLQSVNPYTGQRIMH